MNRISRTHSLVLGVGVALGFAGIGTAFAEVDAASPERVNAHISDARRETRILASFNSDPRLRAYDLTVIVDGGNAVLNGVVEDAIGKALAQRIAADVGGITSVENRIAIGPADAHAQATGQGSDEKIEDATITATIVSSLSRNSATDGLDIHVATHNGRVTLTGIARDLGQKEQAGRIATLTKGVVALSNDIVVGTKADALDKPEAPKPPSAQAVSDRQRAENGDEIDTAASRSALLPMRNVAGAAFMRELARPFPGA